MGSLVSWVMVEKHHAECSCSSLSSQDWFTVPRECQALVSKTLRKDTYTPRTDGTDKVAAADWQRRTRSARRVGGHSTCVKKSLAKCRQRLMRLYLGEYRGISLGKLGMLLFSCLASFCPTRV